MTTLNLRTIRLRSGEQFQGVREVELEPLELGGQRYVPVPERPEAELTITRLSSGLLFELGLAARMHGPCVRCLADAVAPVRVSAREYQATSPAGLEELTTPYLHEARLDLSAWARDAVALSLPDRILCKEGCAGLCPSCGADLNRGACACRPPEPDSRWSKLAELKDVL